MHNSRPILLVEDDIVDAITVKRALGDLKITNPLVHASDGEEALKYLKTRGNEKPCIILLDLNMPKMNGIEFLKVIKTDADLKTIPVIVLTTSKEKRDVIESFELGAAGYMVKPTDYENFVEILGKVLLYWYASESPIEEILLLNTKR